MNSPAAISTAPAGPPLLDRELSWLDFERRVLELAADRRRPLAERLKLCTIVSTNLDEFFAVRVARLHRPGGSRSLLHAVRGRVLALLSEQAELWNVELLAALGDMGVVFADPVARTQLAASRMYAIRPGEESFPYLRSGAVAVASCTGNGSLVIAVPAARARLGQVERGWLAVEGAVAPTLPGESFAFRVTRSAVLGPSVAVTDPLDAVERQLAQRRDGRIVRVEVESDAPEGAVQRLVDALGVTTVQTYASAVPVGLGDFSCLVDAIPRDRRETVWRPTTPTHFASATPDDLFARLRREEQLIHHPYESFEESVQAFANAACDSRVSAVAATVYRTSRPSGTVAALVDAASLGKHAVCVVELRARFDERQNVESSRALRSAGVNVVHGMAESKVHAKMMVITRNEPEGVRRYVHVGTGNYHASNAFGYEDLSLFSADEDLAADVQQVFDALVDNVPPGPFRKLLVGPWYLRQGLMDEIETVIRGAHNGHSGRIRIKVNSLGDEDIIEALYDASRAGVDVQLVVRGACTLLPGVPGTSERISVRSVLGKFLEHSRIFAFESGSSRRVWLGSADLLRRNLDRRIETLAPVDNPRLQAQLRSIFDGLLADTRDAWELDGHGAWSRVTPPDGHAPVSAQEAFMAAAERRRRVGG